MRVAGLILVVDDEAGIRMVVREILEDEGFEVVEAHDGLAALHQLTTCQPALILLDLNMPRMSGWDLQAQLQAQHSPIPVVFMTAGHQAQHEAERHGAVGALSKPFDLDDLLRTVQHFAA